jgi:hypothetical protein
MNQNLSGLLVHALYDGSAVDGYNDSSRTRRRCLLPPYRLQHTTNKRTAHDEGCNQLGLHCPNSWIWKVLGSLGKTARRALTRIKVGWFFWGFLRVCDRDSRDRADTQARCGQHVRCGTVRRATAPAPPFCRIPRNMAGQIVGGRMKLSHAPSWHRSCMKLVIIRGVPADRCGANALPRRK